MRILFVAIANSVHAARWINQTAGQGWDVHLFPVEDAGIHPELHDVTVHGFVSNRPSGRSRSVRLGSGWWPLTRGAATARRIMGRNTAAWQAARLAKVIRTLRPDIVHSLEFQHAGYLTLAARDICGESFPRWIASSWGSDIYHFGRLAEHVERVRRVLASCDYHLADCRRDLRLAQEFGFRGKSLPVFPAGGGFDIAQVSLLRSGEPASARRMIMLKGYQGWAGRGLVGLRAIELSARELQGCRVAIYLAGKDVISAAESVSRSTGVSIEVVPPCSHNDMLRLFGKARLHIGLSISDGTPITLLEALLLGALPIQSNTSAADEWVKDGETGFIVPPEDPEPVAEAIRRAVSDDALADRAAELNWKTATERLDGTAIREQVVAMYREIAENR